MPRHDKEGRIITTTRMSSSEVYRIVADAPGKVIIADFEAATVSLDPDAGGTMSLYWQNAQGGRWRDVPGLVGITSSTAEADRSKRVTGVYALMVVAATAGGGMEVLK